MFPKTYLLSLAAHASLSLAASNPKLLFGGTIVAYDPTTQLPRVLRNGALLITDNQITQLFTSPPSNSSLPPSTELVDCTHKIITPGFIDTHRHGWQTVYKTLGSNTTLGEYFTRYGAPVSQPLFSPEDVYISQKVGIYEALNAGTTTILDHAHHTWTREHAEAGFNATVESGARVFFAYTVQNVTTSNFTVGEQVEQWRELRKRGGEGELTEVVLSYDDFGLNPFGENTRRVVELAK